MFRVIRVIIEASEASGVRVIENFGNIPERGAPCSALIALSDYVSQNGESKPS